MRRRELLALVEGRAAAPEGTRAIAAEGWTAILGETQPLGIFPRGRRQMIDAATARARALEGLLAGGTAVPALPGLYLGEGEVPGLVAVNAALLDRMRGLLSGRVQFQVTVRWSPTAAFVRFGLQAAPESERAALVRRLRAAIAGHLAAAEVERLPLPLVEGVLANHAVLVAAGRTAALDAAVDAIDRLWSEGLKIRVTGPYPGVSFASLALRRVEASEVAAAVAALGLAPPLSEAGLRPARRAALMRAAEADRPAVRAAAELVAAACRAGSAHRGDIILGRSWSEGQTIATPAGAWAA